MAGSCPTEERLACFHEGTLTPEERALVLGHVDGCDGCRQVLAALVAVGTVVKSTEPLPAVLDRYRVLRELGRGAMGRVYAAEDTVLGRTVALKVVRDAASEAGQLLMRESRAVARLSHRNVITLHDVVPREDWGFLAMECIDGGNLASWLASPRSTKEILNAFQQAAEGLAAAHRGGLIHRDFKPANVLIAKDGRVCVTDFGLARVANDPLLATLSGSDATRPTLVGTPAYMAPEQFEGGPLTPAADQFAFFVALHEALTGSRPFEGTSVDSLRSAVKAGRRRTPANLPRALAAMIDRGLSLDPAGRFPSMDEVAKQLALHAAPQRRSTGPFIAVTVGLAIIAVAAVLWPRAQTCPPLTGRELVWTPVQRQAVERALSSDSLVSREVLAALDASAAGLDTAWAESCAGSKPVAQVARQQLCLADVLSQLDVAAQTLASVPASIAPRALPVVRTLPDPRGCAKVESLVERQPPPATEPGRTLVRDGHVLMLEAEALRRLGRYPEALERVQHARTNAEQARYAWLQADAMRLEGRLRNNTGEYDLAEKLLRDALAVAQGTGDTSLIGRIAFAGGFVECLNLSHPDHCATALRVLEEAAARNRSDELEASLAELRAGLAGFRYDLDELIRQSALAQQLWVKVPQSTEDQLRTRASLSYGLDDECRAEKALALRDELLPLAAAYWGPNHARVLQIENFRSRQLLALGRFDEAEKMIEAQLARVGALIGPDTAEYSDLLSDLSVLDENRGELEQAVEELVQANKARPEIRFQMASIGLFMRTGRQDAALALVKRLEEEFDWRNSPATLDRLSETLFLIDYYSEKDPAAHAKLVEWQVAALRARPGAVTASMADVSVQLQVADLALAKRDARAARTALEIAEPTFAGRQNLIFELSLDLQRTRLALLEGDRNAAIKRGRAAVERARALGLKSNLMASLQLRLAEALIGDPKTLAEGCGVLREGLALMQPYKGIDVSAELAHLKRCP